MSNRGSGEFVAEIDLRSDLKTHEIERFNYFIAPATLVRRTSTLEPNREFMRVVVEWQTFNESYAVDVDGDMTFQHGDQLNVLLSTVTSTSRGCINGFEQVEALERAPGVWTLNTNRLK